MFSLLWIPATIAASVFQVARNAVQRGLMASSGPWGATLVRFLFGLPFSVLFATVAYCWAPALTPHFSRAFWLSAGVGALSQVLATASLLVAMQRAGFAVGTALQQSSLPLAALLGLFVYGDQLGMAAWIGVGITTAGLAVLTWPGRRSTGSRPVSGAFFGLMSGLCFGFSLNGFRHATLTLEPAHPVFSALASVAIAQAMQAGTLLAILLVFDRAAVRAVVAGWRESIVAGLCGALASSGWFLALALAPAASVRALGVIESPIAAVAGHRLFSERLRAGQILAGGAVMIGVLLTTLY